eukprot:TRINITY_DN4530_c1_g1_i2.p2 TRINITY_DN4530_c1_g1~~TRINITY_DN4530_c1_g1_i2.p2  ORF type:complete len:106 (+),score=24.02 TRINITY_DN4530_c1_g1_i2:57-374(+)
MFRGGNFARFIGQMAGGFSMGTMYAFARELQPAADVTHTSACEKVLQSIANEPTYWGIGIGIAGICNGPAGLIGLAAGTFGAQNEEHDVVTYARNLYVAARGEQQ